MQRYIEQLIEDLREAKKHVPPIAQFSDDYDKFEEQMLAIETAPDVSVKKLFGLSYEELPPPERISTAHIQQLIDAIIDTWTAFNITIILPEDIPLKLKYELFRDQFSDPIHYMPGWSMHFDFCDGWCPECKIADYCKNKDGIWTKKELEKERRKGNQK